MVKYVKGDFVKINGKITKIGKYLFKMIQANNRGYKDEMFKQFNFEPIHFNEFMLGDDFISINISERLYGVNNIYQNDFVTIAKEENAYTWGIVSNEKYSNRFYNPAKDLKRVYYVHQLQKAYREITKEDIILTL
jgi:hypothetical protein